MAKIQRHVKGTKQKKMATNISLAKKQKKMAINISLAKKRHKTMAMATEVGQWRHWLCLLIINYVLSILRWSNLLFSQCYNWSSYAGTPEEECGKMYQDTDIVTGRWIHCTLCTGRTVISFNNSRIITGSGISYGLPKPLGGPVVQICAAFKLQR